MVDCVPKGLRRKLAFVPAAPAIALWLAAAPVWAAAPTTGSTPVPAPSADLVGAYLAGRAAQATRDFPAAATWYEKAIALDPQAPELISRTFLMEVVWKSPEASPALAGTPRTEILTEVNF